jgi:hypothetical protein
LRRDRPQASRSRHCRAGRPSLSPLIPGCSVAGDQGPSRFPVRGPMLRRCPEGELAAPRQGPSVPRPREGGFWRQMAARPARATRRAASATSGFPAGRGSGSRHVRAHWFGHAHLRTERVACTYIYEPVSILTHGSLEFIDDRHAAFSTVLVGIRSPSMSGRGLRQRSGLGRADHPL